MKQKRRFFKSIYRSSNRINRKGEYYFTLSSYKFPPTPAYGYINQENICESKPTHVMIIELGITKDYYR